MKTIITSTYRMPYGSNRTNTVTYQVTIDTRGIRVDYKADGPGVAWNRTPADIHTFQRALDHARETFALVPSVSHSREVRIQGVLPTRTATFFQMCEGQETIDAPGRSKLAQLITGYIKGQDVPVESIWDYIQEIVVK